MPGFGEGHIHFQCRHASSAAAFQVDISASKIREHFAPQFGARYQHIESPLAAVIPGQVLAKEVALVKGYPVDTPRGLSKVTVTR